MKICLTFFARMPFFKILQGKMMKEIKQTAHINGGGGGRHLSLIAL
ncbi:hypothetical protein [Campylobacter troglodytis]|nr:hypothetical protein [Campylobacter troglodytis]